MTEFPALMIHPNARRSKMRTEGLNTFGTPDVFPPVTVENEIQEQQHRAQGYRMATEEEAARVYHEYPLWMVCEGKPDALCANAEQEAGFAEKGYKRAGQSDPEAFSESRAPMPDGLVYEEYPKWVGDRVVKDAAEEAAILEKMTAPAKKAARA